MGHNRDHKRAEEAALLGWMVLAEGSHTGFQCAGDVKISKERWIPTGAYSLLGQDSVRWVIKCPMGD